jgi:hypothetical protein
MTHDNEDEWKTVTKHDKKRVAKRSRRRPTQPQAHNQYQMSSVTKNLSLEDLQESLDECLSELDKSSFFENLQKSLLELPNHQSISTMVCYGIGNFLGAKASAPLWQLACAIAIRKVWNHHRHDDDHADTMEMWYFDPCMTPEEAQFLKRQSIQIIPHNERGQRLVQESTFFFMPHCPLSLYTHVLHTNWDQLDRIIMFGNSLTAYANRLLEVNGHVRLLHQLEAYWTEKMLAMKKEDIATMTGYFEQAFNDSSIIHFVTTTTPKDEKWPARPEFLEEDDGGETI